MDPMYLPYSQANGVPQESKLATYMNHQNTNSSSSLNQSLATLSLDPVSVKKENVGGTTYFYPSGSGEPSSISNSELGPTNAGPPVLMPNFNMYPGSPTHVSSMKEKPNVGYYVSEELRIEQMHRNALILAQPDPEQYPDLPNEIDNYRDLCPLKAGAAPGVHKSQLMGYTTSTYKATNAKTGIRYCLQRVHGVPELMNSLTTSSISVANENEIHWLKCNFMINEGVRNAHCGNVAGTAQAGYRLPNTKCMSSVEVWKRVEHSNIIQLREVFTTKAFGDSSIIFVYDYHPGSETLMAKHFSQCESSNGYTDPFSADPNAPRPYSHQKNKILLQQQANLLPESIIWNYIIQITSGLRVVHAAGLACRTLDPSNILLSGLSHVRLNSLGIPDVLSYDSNQSQLLSLYQQEDLTSLGKVVLALACKSLIAVQRENIQTSMELVTRHYSRDLRNLIVYLLNTSQAPQGRSVTDLMPMIGARFYTQLDAVQARADLLENELAKEMENGRLCRLLVKLGTVNERPELNMDQTWSETGDRYMLKLFRDYLFHQVTEDGTPWLDMSHVVQCLNKLDAGVSDKICLVSRDGQSVLVVSYAELKHCLEQSFSEILSAATKQDVIA